MVKRFMSTTVLCCFLITSAGVLPVLGNSYCLAPTSILPTSYKKIKSLCEETIDKRIEDIEDKEARDTVNELIQNAAREDRYELLKGSIDWTETKILGKKIKYVNDSKRHIHLLIMALKEASRAVNGRELGIGHLDPLLQKNLAQMNPPKFKVTEQRLTDRRKIIIEGFDKAVLALGVMEKEKITMKIQWIWEFDQWVPDKLVFPPDAVNLGEFSLKRSYDQNGKLIRVSKNIQSDEFISGGFVSMRVPSSQQPVIVPGHQYTLGISGDILISKISENKVPQQIVLVKEDGSFNEADLMTYKKEGVLLATTIYLSLALARKLQEEHGEGLEVGNIKISPSGHLHFGEGRILTFHLFEGARAEVNIGMGLIEKGIRLVLPESQAEIGTKPRLLIKDGKIIGSHFSMGQEKAKELYEKHGPYWITEIDPIGPHPEYDVHAAGQSFYCPLDYINSRASFEIGERGIVTKVRYAAIGKRPELTCPTILVVKDGIPVKSYLDVENFDPQKHGEVELKGIPIPDDGLVLAAGRIYELEKHGGMFADIKYDAAANPASIVVKDENNKKVMEYKPNDVLSDMPAIRRESIFTDQERRLLLLRGGKLAKLFANALENTDPAKTKMTKQRLKSRYHIHVDGLDEHIVRFSKKENENVTVDICWIWELDKWAPDRVVIPEGAVNAGEIKLKRYYDNKGNLVRVANFISREGIPANGLVSTRVPDAGDTYTTPDNKYDFGPPGSLVLAQLNGNKIPVQIGVFDQSGKAEVQDLIFYVKNGRLLRSTLKFDERTLSKLMEEHGEIDLYKTISPAEELLSLGERETYYLWPEYIKKYLGSTAIIHFGEHAYPTEIRLIARDLKSKESPRLRTFTKNEKVIGTGFQLPRQKAKYLYEKHGKFTVKGVIVGSHGLLSVAGQRLSFWGYGRADAEVDIGENGIITEVRLRAIGNRPALTHRTVIVVRAGKPVEAFLRGLYRDWERIESVVGIKGLQFMQDPFKEAGRGLTLEEEKMLVLLYREGSGAALDTLVRFNKRFIQGIVNAKIAKSPRLAGEAQDMFVEGVIGFMRALDKFDLSKGFKITTYAANWVKQNISRYLINSSRTIRLPVHIIDKMNRLFRIERRYIQQYGREPKNYEELLEFDPLLGMSQEQYNSVMAVRESEFRQAASLDQAISTSGDQKGDDVTAAGGEDLFGEDLKRRDLINMLDKAFKRLREHGQLKTSKDLDRDIKMLGLRIGYDFEERKIAEPQTLEEIGQQFDITRERVRQLVEEKLMPHFRKILTGLGVDLYFLEDDVVLPGKADKAAGFNQRMRETEKFASAA